MNAFAYAPPRRIRLSRNHWLNHWIHMGFEANVDVLQEHLGYTFANRDILVQALTSPAFATLFPEGCASNATLESEGDRILRDGIEKWIGVLGIANTALTGFLRNFLNSNLYFSRRALELQLDSCVRVHAGQMRAQVSMSQIRLTANAFEALTAAIHRDAGLRACRAFVARHVLPNDALTRNLLLLASLDLESVRTGFSGLVNARASFRLNYGYKQAEATVVTGDVLPIARASAKEATEAVRSVAIRALVKAPWLLWGSEGPMSMYLPCASRSAYGAPVWNQDRYHSGRSVVPEAWLAAEDAVQELIDAMTPPSPPPRPRFHEEDAWPAFELPTLLPNSTAERGPYIDKLRRRFEPSPLEVRIKEGRKGQPSRFAFYVDDEHRGTVEGKNVNDAANQFMRLMGE